MATLMPIPVAARTASVTTTPQILNRSLWAVWILDVILLVALLSGGRVHRAGLQTIGRDAAPSIITAQHIKSALADMDADAANELLGEGTQANDAVQAYENRRLEASKALIAAAQNVTYGDAEREPILRIQLGLGNYEARIQRTRDLRQEGNEGWIAAYGAAADLMDREILPAADALDQANLDALNRTYESQHGRSVASRGFIMATAFVLLIVLASVQLFITGRTHRLINIPLLLATCITVGMTYYGLRVLARAQNDLKVAREDAFTSIHALWRTRAVAYAANADESRYLLDRGNAAKHEQEFMTKRNALATLPDGATFQSIMGAENTRTSHFTGYLADELNNITFPGEREAALETLGDFAEYLRVDGQIRMLERGGHHKEAIALCTGTKPGQSNWNFEKFDSALDRTLFINQTAFDRAVANGFAALTHFDLQMSICAVVVGVLTLLGVLQRIREYR
jgi:hypothetical protein